MCWVLPIHVEASDEASVLSRFPDFPILGFGILVWWTLREGSVWSYAREEDKEEGTSGRGRVGECPIDPLTYPRNEGKVREAKRGERRAWRGHFGSWDTQKEQSRKYLSVLKRGGRDAARRGCGVYLDAVAIDNPKY